MSLFELSIIALLATYRIAALLNAQDKETGPGHSLDRLRKWLGVEYDEKGKAKAQNWRAEILLCYFCTSMWIGLFLTVPMIAALVFHANEVAALFLLPFALSGGAMFLRKWAG